MTDKIMQIVAWVLAELLLVQLAAGLGVLWTLARMLGAAVAIGATGA